MHSSPPRRQPQDRSSPLGCLCEAVGAAVGFLVVTVAAFVFIPAPPPKADKTIREARGVYAVLFGLGGFVVGYFVGCWVGKVIRRSGRQSGKDWPEDRPG
jgi:hypothetical protein